MIDNAYLHCAPVSLPEVSVPTGTSAPLTETATRAASGLLVQAPTSNTVSVYVGGSGVTTGTGIILAPGVSISISLADASKLYSIAGAAGQKLRVLAL